MTKKYHVKTGDTFHDLTALQPVRLSLWQWRCRCDQLVEKQANLVCSGHVKSCGCRKGWDQTSHGMTTTKEYHALKDAKRRCNNPDHPQYRHYGGRGIQVCERWSRFEHFFADMGYAPSHVHSLDRIDNNKGYSPDNCRWATQKEQANNTRANHMINYNGEQKTLTQWAEHVGLHRSLVDERLRSDWSVDRALNTPKGQTQQDVKRREKDKVILSLLAAGRIDCDKEGNVYSGAIGKGSNGPKHKYKLRTKRNGTKTLGVSIDRYSYNFYVARIIALKFIKNDNPINHCQVRHKDGEPANNHVTNLYWASPS